MEEIACFLEELEFAIGLGDLFVLFWVEEVWEGVVEERGLKFLHFFGINYRHYIYTK